MKRTIEKMLERNIAADMKRLSGTPNGWIRRVAVPRDEPTIAKKPAAIASNMLILAPEALL